MPLRVPTETLKKIQPKLRMIADGDSTVNAVRAERSGALTVENAALLRKVPPTRGAHAVPVALGDLKRRPAPKKLTHIASDVVANVFVYLRDSEAEDLPSRRRPYSRRGRIAMLQTTLNDLPRIAGGDNVAYVEVAEALKVPTPALAELRPDPPAVSLRRFGKPAEHRYGEEVLIGIVDVQGFDFAHPDFLDDRGRTRFVRIWDQGGDSRPSPEADGQF